MPRPRHLLPGLMLLLAGPALANDSTAELTTGGLSFTTTPDVEMVSEDLFVSSGEIRVAYRFLNHADHDVTSTVAFPMPDITIDTPDTNLAIPSDNPADPLGFHTRVDGRNVPMRLDERVIARGKDRTALLKNLGVPLAPWVPATEKALTALPAADHARLIAEGLAEEDEYDDTGTGMVAHLEPRWTWRAAYHWTQTFPAGREISIEHRYTPSVGGYVATNLAGAGSEPDTVAEYRRTYCIDDTLLRTVRRIVDAAGPTATPLSEQRIAYVLKTGANWAGPIGRFHLTVDKGASANLVSFCADGVAKTGPTRFEVRHEAFTPTADLAVLILVRNHS